MKKQGYTALSGVLIATAIMSSSPASADDIPEIPTLPDSYVAGNTGPLQVEFQPIPEEARKKVFELASIEETEPTTSTVTVTPTPRTTQRTVTAEPQQVEETQTQTEVQQAEASSDETIILPPDWEGFVDDYVERTVGGSSAPSSVTASPPPGSSSVPGPSVSAGSSAALSSLAPQYDSDVAQKIIDYAYNQLGVPYVWGGTTTGVGLDCSGLTQNAYAAAGISIPRVTYDQINSGTHVSVSNIQPGDLVFYNNTQHVALYIGDNQVIHAPTPGQVVTIDSLTMMPVQAVVRPLS